MIFFEHRLLYPIKEEVPEKLEPIPLGKARVVREGTDVTVIATGPLVHRSLEAADAGRGGGHLGRGRRPAHAAAARRGGARRVGEEDEPRGRRARGRDADGLRRRGRGRAAGAGVRLARRADRARRREVRAARVRARDGAVRDPAARGRARRDQAHRREDASRWRARSSCRASARAWRCGTIVKWLKAEGDPVEKGEPLYELDTDKVDAGGRGRGLGRAAEDRRRRRARCRSGRPSR